MMRMWYGASLGLLACMFVLMQSSSSFVSAKRAPEIDLVPCTATLLAKTGLSKFEVKTGQGRLKLLSTADPACDAETDTDKKSECNAKFNKLGNAKRQLGRIVAKLNWELQKVEADKYVKLKEKAKKDRTSATTDTTTGTTGTSTGTTGTTGTTTDTIGTATDTTGTTGSTDTTTGTTGTTDTTTGTTGTTDTTEDPEPFDVVEEPPAELELDEEETAAWKTAAAKVKTKRSKGKPSKTSFERQFKYVCHETDDDAVILYMQPDLCTQADPCDDLDAESDEFVNK